MNKQEKNILFGVLLVLFLAGVYYYGGVFSIIGIDTYIPYSSPTGAVNPGEWNIQGMRRAIDLDNRATFRQIEPTANNQSVFIMTHVGEAGNQGTSSVVYTQQDLKGKDFRIFIDGDTPPGWYRYVRLKDIIGCQQFIRPNEQASAEIQSSILDENKVLFKVNGRNVCEVTVSNETRVQMEFEISAPGSSSPNNPTVSMFLSSPGYRLPLGCRLGPNDVTVFEAFDPQSEIDIFTLTYPAKRICTVLVQTPTAVGVDRSHEVGQLLARGETIVPGELFEPDTILSVLYTVDNSNNILPRFCTQQEVLANGECQPRNSMTQVCSRGVFSLEQLTCTVQANQICEGGTLVQINSTHSVCRFLAPVGQPCVAGTYNNETGTCDQIFDPINVDCRSLGYEPDSQNPRLCISHVRDDTTFNLNAVYISVFALGIVTLGVLIFLKIFTLWFLIVLVLTIISGALRFII